MMKKAALILLLSVAGVFADVYLQSPRGSNNRLNEANAERNNDARLFDSQNNNRGGFNVGDKTTNAATTTETSPAQIYNEADTTTAIQYSLVYYEGSVVQLEWTNQHGCGGNALDDPTLQNCNLIFQYMCDNTNTDPALAVALRDGTTTNQVNTNGQTTSEGIHESAAYYAECATRSRNQGLFTADQNLNGNTARFTRQNPNGDRNGLECAEERDYYPYWLPTPWVDIAYMTDRMDFCGADGYIARNSQNSSPKYKCFSATNNANQLNSRSQEQCTATGGVWTTQRWNVPAPDCIPAQWSRSNHLGNARGTGNQMMNYNWTLPSFSTLTDAQALNFQTYDTDYVKCVLRMRYNISTDDYDMWNINSTQNQGNSPVKGNQQVNVGADLQSIQMSINTNQFGRTFQDRSHVFYIRRRPAGLPATAKITNLNVRGKRGNIVQCYPALEYDFVPNRLHVSTAEYIHLQWTGSNTHNNNPNAENAGDGQGGDAGEGTAGTDRHNFVQIGSLSENFPLPLDKYPNNFFANTDCFKLNLTPIGSNTPGQTNADCAVYLATSGFFRSAGAVTGAANGNDGLNPTLDNAPPSLIGGVLLKVRSAGEYSYIGSRNNNFSNRSEKGVILVSAPSA